jgi:hypothetical protein
MALSIASTSASSTPVAGALVLFALAAIVGLGVVERRAVQRLLPSGTFVFGSTLAIIFGAMVLLQMSIISDVFIPLFLQRLHGVGPLVAGYMVALLAVGWSTSSMVVAGWPEDRSRLLIVGGPVLLLTGAIGLALFVGRESAIDLFVLLGIGLSLLLMGAGIGSAWTHLTPRAMKAAPAGEHDVTSAALNTIQLLASGMGASLAGLIVNAAGLTVAGDASMPANGLYGLWILVPALALPLVIVLVRREAVDSAVAQPAE